MKIVSLAPSNTEIIYSLNAGDQLVATTNLFDHPEDIEKPGVGGWINPDIEKVKHFEPDLVLASDDLQDKAVKELESEGLRVEQFKPHNLEQVYCSILRIGEIVNREDKAAELVRAMKTEISTVNLEGRRIYCEEWMNPPMVSGNWVPDLIQKAGGNYFIENGRSHEFELEKLKSFDPEYIFLNVCGAGKNVEEKKITERENWQELKAVKKDQIFTIDDSLLNRPSPRLVKALEEIEKKIN